MRTDEVMENHKSIRIEDLNSNGIERARLGVLMEISETLSILTDMYGIVHGREFSTKPKQPVQQPNEVQSVPQIPVDEDIPKQ